MEETRKKRGGQPKPDHERKSENLVLRLKKDQMSRLDSKAKSEGMTRSDFVRRIIENS